MIKTHKELAAKIAGKRILHLNSLGKDSLVCLDWLYNYAKVEIISVNYQFMSKHPYDDFYLDYLTKKFPKVLFISEPNPWELTQVLTGLYQLPTEIYDFLNDLEYDTIDAKLLNENLRQVYECDYICRGESRYEAFHRATFFHKKGILVDKDIYPIGMMSKQQIHDLIRDRGLKIHPQYKMNKSTLDFPSYYKMRAWFKAKPEYKKLVYTVFPMLVLDEYRYEKLLTKGERP